MLGEILLFAGIVLIVVGALRGEGRRGQAVLVAGVVVTALAVALWGPEMYTSFMENHERRADDTGWLSAGVEIAYASFKVVMHFIARLIALASRVAVML